MHEFIKYPVRVKFQLPNAAADKKRQYDYPDITAKRELARDV